jgi:hypothetical protein
MLYRLSNYTAQISQRAHVVAGKDAEAHEGLVILVIFFDGVVWTQPRFIFADFVTYIDIVAAF